MKLAGLCFSSPGQDVERHAQREQNGTGQREKQ